MATIARVTCPECETTLRPAKPVEEGKKIKCPKCSHVFVVRGGEDEDEAPKKKSAKKPEKAAKKPEKAGATKKAEKKDEPKKPTYDDDDDGPANYGYIKEDEEEEEAKPKIDYLAMNKSTDLRGPAIKKLVPPSAKLQMAGLAGAIGWLLLILMLTILVVFPVKEDDADRERAKRDAEIAKKDGEKVKKSDPKAAFNTNLYGYNLGENYYILIAPLILCTLYSAVIVGGSIKMVTLESRTFGIVAAVMLMLPVHMAGLGSVLTVTIQFAMYQVFEDQPMADMVTMVLNGLLYLICVGIGAWNLVVLNDQEVKDGFEYVGE